VTCNDADATVELNLEAWNVTRLFGAGRETEGMAYAPSVPGIEDF
jgi:hypothetical protein